MGSEGVESKDPYVRGEQTSAWVGRFGISPDHFSIAAEIVEAGDEEEEDMGRRFRWAGMKGMDGNTFTGHTPRRQGPFVTLLCLSHQSK